MGAGRRYLPLFISAYLTQLKTALAELVMRETCLDRVPGTCTLCH